VSADDSSDPALAADVTGLLRHWGAGDEEALHALLPEVISELRATARRLMASEPAGVTLQPTALVSELYLKLRGCHSPRWESRAHFFAFAAQAMRLILVDAARTRRRGKRGGDAHRVPIEEVTARLAAPGAPDLDVVALDRALDRLDSLAPRLARLVELRYFAGLTMEQVAETLSISPATAYRDWGLAKSWLYRELMAGEQGR
jgi:RNA polymerase sigma-70 factor, ECF subfamily